MTGTTAITLYCVAPAFGIMVYGAAVIVTAVGVVLLWMDRSKTRQAESRP